MKPFGFWCDPLCLLAVLSYAVNRWLTHHGVTQPFFCGYFDDGLLIPAALPIVLGMQRGLGLRRHRLPPTWGEIFSHITVWAVICELVGPRWGHHGVADGWDVVAYVVGGVFAGLWWHRAAIHGVNPERIA